MVKKLMYLAVVSLLLGVVGQNVVWADKGADHQVFQERPIQLGTSGGNIHDRSQFYCCSGTLGALVKDAEGVKYILGNNHVLARLNAAAIGEAINQPGQVDQNCGQVGAVADLSDFVELLFDGSANVVDAAIAEIRLGACSDNDGNPVDCVDTSGSILDIGQISSNTVAAVLNKKVKKSGRTTGLTSGSVSAVDVTIDVSYSDECGGSTTKVARFVNQFLVRPGKFSRGGDSSSLIVEADDVDPVDGLPRATGLLFAGSKFYTIANPIDAVLNQLGVTMVGGTAPDPDPDPDPDPPGPGAGTILGTVTDNTADNIPIKGAKVRVDSGQSGKTDAAGNYTVTGVPAGTHSAKASAKGFESQTITGIEVVDAATTEVDFELSPRVKGRQSAIKIARNAKARHGKKLLEISGVVGHGIGLSKKERPVIQVYLEDDLPQARAQIPATLDGVAVRVLVTGPFEAF
jgi:hypothetical protein